jgi:hypothetical protein
LRGTSKRRSSSLTLTRGQWRAHPALEGTSG